MANFLAGLWPVLAGVITAGGLWDISRRRERYKAERDDKDGDSKAVQSARVDERDRCAERLAELHTDMARLSGRIHEQGAELTDMRHQTYRSDRARLVAEGRAMAMKSLAEGAGADQRTVDMIWARHDPDTIAGRMPT